MVTVQDVLARTLATMRSEATDMPLSQRAILLAVASDENVYLAQLADLLGCNSSTVTRGLNRLIDAGLVERQPHPTDDRIVRATTTSKGADVIQEILAIERRNAGDFDVIKLEGPNNG